MSEANPGDPGEPTGDATFESRYQILSKLGEGGFGTVHKAKQLSTGQLVALKLLRAPADATRTARFLRETRLCAQLHHPNIVRLVDSGQTATGSLYIAFAFAPGETLADLLERDGALPPREARHLMLQVLDALSCAHATGVIHRDLKPSNIMVSRTGARRNAVVLDFGIGAMLDDERSTRITGSGEGLGTPGYSAPEQWRGAEPSPSADIFSWGLVFLECLAGSPVYAGTSAAIFYHLLGADPVALPPALKHHPLGSLLASALEKAAGRREANARALLDALEDCDLRGLTQAAIAGAEPAAPPPLIMLPHGGAIPDSLPRAESGERRQLTAMCCQITTELPDGGEADPELLDDPLRRAIELCAEVGRRYRGHVVGVLGAELLIYFGYPSASEDDVRRAARAALAITDRIRTAEHPSAPIAVAIGVHTGMVIDGEVVSLGHARLLTGVTPRRAAQLAAATPPGTIAVSAASERLLRDTFAFDLDAAANGIGQAERFRLHGEKLAAAQLGSERLASPIAGRDSELALLLDRWRRARQGAGQVSLITGEPGIGKSRLARALRDRLTEEAQFLEIRFAFDAQNAALAAVVELLERTLGIDQHAEPAEKSRQLARELDRHGLEPAAMMPLFLPLVGLPVEPPYAPPEVSAQKLKSLTLDAIAALIFAIAERKPVLLLAEDLHWADPTSMELLSQLTRTAPEAAICIVMTARPEYAPAFPTAGMLLLPLSRLERTHIEQMLAALALGKSLPVQVVDQVAERADGVPLFIEELLRMLIDAGLLIEREHCYELTAPLVGSAIPGSLRALLTARLDRLSRARETAQLAAALGREFNLDVLTAASSQRREVLADDLERLIAAGLIQRKRRGKDVVGVFKHALIRDAAYESLASAARRKVHARIAQTLEARFSAIAVSRPDLLAYHHAAAEQFDHAISFGMRATRLAAEQSQNPEAIAHGHLLQAHIAHRPQHERASLELALNGILTPVYMATYGHGSDRSKTIVGRSQQLLREIGDSEHRFSTLCSLSFHHHHRGDRRDARASARELLDLALRDGDIGRQVLAYTLLGQCRWIDGDYVEADKLLARAIELYEPSSHAEHGLTLGTDTRTWATAALGHVRWFTGETELARAAMRKALGWAEDQKIIATRGMAHLYDALLCQYAGDKRGAAAASSTAIALSEQYGLPTYDMYCRILLAWANNDVESAAGVLAKMEQLDCRLGFAYYASLSAETLMERRDFAQALARLEACAAMCAQMDERYYEPELHLRIALCKLQCSAERPAAAQASLHHAQQLARAQSMLKTEADALVDEAIHFGWRPEARARIAEIAAARPHALQGERLVFARSARIAT